MKLTGLLAGAALAVLSAAAAQAQSGPVKIGVLNDMSSLYADIGGKGSVEAAKMAAEDAGPVLGQAVQIVSADHQNKPDVGSALARNWIDVDGVDAIVDLPNSAVGLAVNDVLRGSTATFLASSLGCSNEVLKCAAAPGMPQTTLLASSCPIAAPPASITFWITWLALSSTINF